MSPTTPGDPQKGKPDRERTEFEAEQAKSAAEEAAPQPEAAPSAPGEPEAEGTAAEVTGVDKAGALGAASG